MANGQSSSKFFSQRLNSLNCMLNAISPINHHRGLDDSIISWELWKISRVTCAKVADVGKMFVCCLFRFQSQQFTLYELVKLPLNFLYGDRQRNATHNVNFAVNSHFFSYIVLSCHKSGRILCDFHIDVRAVLFSTISSRRAVDADRSPSEMSGLER